MSLKSFFSFAKNHALEKELLQFRQTLQQSGHYKTNQLPSKKLIRKIAKHHPQDAAQLLGISGFSPAKMTQYGSAMLRILKKHAK